MFPPTQALTLLPDRPKSLLATGRTSHCGLWMVTEFQGEDGKIYYKYQRGLGRKFECMFYEKKV